MSSPSGVTCIEAFSMCHLPEDLVSRLLTAAHSAPSVGLMQLSRFIVILG